MITEQLAPSDIAGIHSRHRVVHKQVDVQVSNPHGLGDRAVRLPKVVAPLRKRSPILFVLDYMSARAWECVGSGSGS